MLDVRNLQHSNHHALTRAYHKLVNTTPNPRATKNNKGELEPVPPPSFLSFGLSVGVAALSVALLIADGIEGIDIIDGLRPDVGEPSKAGGVGAVADCTTEVTASRT